MSSFRKVFESTRPARSMAYQYKMHEAYYDPVVVNYLADSHGLHHESIEKKEHRADLKEKLLELTFSLIEKNLTKHQKEVLFLILKGYSQIEVAKELGVNQSSVTKCLHGNLLNDGSGKFYGGLFKRLKKAAALDQEIQKVLKELVELNDI